jgi:hypothetical protein
MDCRAGCAACCIVPSISSPIPGMAQGKPAFVRCVQLSDDNRCLLFGRPERPAVCRSLRPEPEMCGAANEDAFRILTQLELSTRAIIDSSPGSFLGSSSRSA